MSLTYAGLKTRIGVLTREKKALAAQVEKLKQETWKDRNKRRQLENDLHESQKLLRESYRSEARHRIALEASNAREYEQARVVCKQDETAFTQELCLYFDDETLRRARDDKGPVLVESGPSENEVI